MNSIPDCFANYKILPLRRDVISVGKSPWRKFLMVTFETITNSVATVLCKIPLTYDHYVSIDYLFFYLWLVFYGGLQLSRWQKQIDSMLYFYPAEYTNLVSSVYILLAPLLSSVHIDRDQKKPVSTIFIRNLEMKSPRSCVRVRFYI